MKEHQIIQMLHKVIAENTSFTTWTVSTPHLVALVNHAVKQEREECINLIKAHGPTLANGFMLTEEIRARGEL
jgi:hypothetical protein